MLTIRLNYNNNADIALCKKNQRTLRTHRTLMIVINNINIKNNEYQRAI